MASRVPQHTYPSPLSKIRPGPKHTPSLGNCGHPLLQFKKIAMPVDEHLHSECQWHVPCPSSIRRRLVGCSWACVLLVAMESGLAAIKPDHNKSHAQPVCCPAAQLVLEGPDSTQGSSPG